MDFLTVQGPKIVQGRAPVMLRGVNLGGWLLMEGYILHSPNDPVQAFRKTFAQALGQRALAEFDRDFRDHFIRQEDFRQIAKMGFNCVRVPFHYRLIEDTPYKYSKTGLAYFDRVISWARETRIRVIFDLHAACGSQNHDWHSDSRGMAEFWSKPANRSRTLAMWAFLADRYKDEPVVAGYDLLNEAVTGDVKLLNDFYRRLIKAVRRVDRNHILFVEGNNWARDLDVLEEFDDANLVLSIHFYEPLDFTFNFVPHLRYPMRSRGKGGRFDAGVLRKQLAHYRDAARARSRPVFVGEFGVNSRQGLYGEDRWLADILRNFHDFGFHWTYWTYKAVKNSVFPDGLFSYYDNPDWVRRHGPRQGWDNYALLWGTCRAAMRRSWQTDAFRLNTRIAGLLRKAAKKR